MPEAKKAPKLWIAFYSLVGLIVLLSVVKLADVNPPDNAVVYVIGDTIYPPGRTGASDTRAVKTTWVRARRSGAHPYDITGFNVERSVLGAILGLRPYWLDGGGFIELGVD